MIHRNYICGYILKKMHKSDGLCKLCNKLERQRTHIFMKCEIIHKVFEHFSFIIKSFDSRDISEKEKAFGIVDEINSKVLLRNYTTFIIRHIIYRNRNITLKRGENITVILINKVMFYIRKDLHGQFCVAKNTNDTQSFKDKYLVEGIFGNLQNNELINAI